MDEYTFTCPMQFKPGDSVTHMVRDSDRGIVNSIVIEVLDPDCLCIVVKYLVDFTDSDGQAVEYPCYAHQLKKADHG